MSDRGQRYTPLVAALAAATLIVCGLLATSAVAAQCPNEQLRVEDRSTLLPDCRAYELVSPARKEGTGGVLYFEVDNQPPFPMQAAPMTSAGEAEPAVIYTGESFYQALTGYFDEYVSKRAPAGWITTSLTPAGGQGQFNVIAASGALTSFLVDSQLEPTEPSRYRNLYLKETAGSSARPLITVTPPHRSVSEFGYAEPERPPYGSTSFVFASAASDLSRVFFEANDSLLPGSGALERELGEDVEKEVEAGEDHNYIYEWDDGQLHLVNVLPEAEGGGVARRARLGKYYGQIVQNELVPNLDHVVSGNGSEVFWTSEETGNLYVREDGAKTTLISAGGEFLAATPDGARAFFVTGGSRGHDVPDVADDRFDGPPALPLRGGVRRAVPVHAAARLAAAAHLDGGDQLRRPRSSGRQLPGGVRGGRPPRRVLRARGYP